MSLLSTRGLSILVVVVGGCFAEAPGVQTGTSSDTMRDTDDPPASSTTSASSTTDTGSQTVDESTSGGIATSDETALGSTGEPQPACTCPPSSLFCNDFERWSGPWSYPGQGGGTAEQNQEEAFCGSASARTAVSPGDTYASMTAGLGITTADFLSAPHSVHVAAYVDPACTREPDFVRVLSVVLPQSSGTFWYAWDVRIRANQVRLSVANNSGTRVDSDANLSIAGGWVELQLDIDPTGGTPAPVLHVDGTVISPDTLPPPLNPSASTEQAEPAAELGPFRFNQLFTTECVMHYDDVWLAPM